MTGRALLLRRLEAVEAAHFQKTEEKKRAQVTAALLTLPHDCQTALRDERAALKDPQAWAAFLEEARRYYTAHGEDLADLSGPALWCGEEKKTQPGQPFPVPKAAHSLAAKLEAHALRLWAAQDTADTPQARRFFRYGGAFLRYRAALVRVLGGPA